MAAEKKAKWKPTPERGEYRGIFVAILDSPEFLALSAEATACFWPLKLLLGRAGIATIPGASAVLSQYTKLPVEDCQAALDELIATDWVKVEGSVVWMRNGLRFDPTMPLHNTNHKKSIETYLKTLPKTPIVNECARYYGLEIPFPNVKPSPMPSPMPSRKGFGRALNGKASGMPSPMPSPKTSPITDDGCTEYAERKTESALPVTDPVPSLNDIPDATATARQNGGGGGGDEEAALEQIERVLAEFVDEQQIGSQLEIRIRNQLKPLLRGLDATVWKDQEGNDAPWSARPGLIQLALYRLASEPEPNGLRKHVKYVVLQQLSPHPRESDKPADLDPREKQKLREAIEQQREKKRAKDQAETARANRIQAWIDEHPRQAVTLETQIRDDLIERSDVVSHELLAKDPRDLTQEEKHALTIFRLSLGVEFRKHIAEMLEID